MISSFYLEKSKLGNDIVNFSDVQNENFIIAHFPQIFISIPSLTFMNCKLHYVRCILLIPALL